MSNLVLEHTTIHCIMTRLNLKVAFLFAALTLVVAQELCPPGSFTTRTGTCKQCPVGTYQPQSGQNGCKPCQGADIAAMEGSASCTPCGTNEQPNSRRTACTCVRGASRAEENGACEICPPGTLSALGSDPCIPCRRNTFQPLPGQTRCVPCPNGSFATGGARECTSCPQGEVLIGLTCGRCPAGQLYSRFDLTCEPCNPGTFKSMQGQGPCLRCRDGTFSDAGATQCFECPDGQAAIRRGSTSRCGTCPPGHYLGSRCFRCERNSFQPNETISNGCFSCPSNSFAMRGATECTTCGPGEGLMTDGSCSRCPPGFEYFPFSFRCLRCRFNSISSGRVDEGCENCPLGTSASSDLGECRPCPPGELHLRSTGECGTCAAGRFYERFTGRCRRCPAQEFSASRGVAFSCERCPNGLVPNDRGTRCVAA